MRKVFSRSRTSISTGPSEFSIWAPGYNSDSASDAHSRTTLAALLERLELNLDAQATVRALTEGEIAWTLHRACSYASDPGQWGASLVNDAEVMLACLDAAGARSVVEVGAYAGDLTALLLEWASASGARVLAVDPSPQEELVQLDAERDDLELIRATSLDALERMALPDAVIVDGDHNYYTVSEELRLIAEKAQG